MDRKAQLQFRLLSHDAQRSAIRRLALRGLDDEEISQTTGWASDEIRQLLEPIATPGFIPWVSAKRRRSGSPGGPLRHG